MKGNSYWQPGRREDLWQDSLRSGKFWDVIVVGGGITGAGIFNECTRLGLRTLLLEKHDFAWGTSSKSSKMVHGGLRYLATGQLKLTLDSVREREKLLNEAPGLVDPLAFVMGHYRGEFPPGFLFNRVLDVYDKMAGERNHQHFPKSELPFIAPGMTGENLSGITQFGDAVTDDARLVMRVLHQGVTAGGVAVNYAAVESVVHHQGKVSGVSVTDRISGRQAEVRASLVINATGAWADQLRLQEGQEAKIRPLRGSHLVLPWQRFPVSSSISFFHPKDKRPVFVFPWEGVAVVGTTDLDHNQDMEQDARITEEEAKYLLNGVNKLFPGQHITQEDVLCTWSGIRPVVAGGQLDPSKEKREHSVWDDNGLISVAGGKLTTFRLIALDVLKAAEKYLGFKIPAKSKNRIFRDAPPQNFSSELTDRQARRLAGRYGRHAADVVQEERAGEPIKRSNVLWGEVDWTLKHEAVQHLDDLLLRRTRFGLLVPDGGVEAMDGIRDRCKRILGWSGADWDREYKRYQEVYLRDFSLPGNAEPVRMPLNGARTGGAS